MEEENYQEEYALEDHYANAPQVYNTHAQENSRYFMEEEHQPQSLRRRAQRDSRNKYPDSRNGQQYQQIQNEEIMMNEEVWPPAKENDLLFSDVSAIHHVPRNKGNSLNNSFFENPFNEAKSREEFDGNDSQNHSLSLDGPLNESIRRNKGFNPRPSKSRRGPVYNDSSDSETDIRIGSQKMKNEGAMEILDEKSEKRRFEDYRRTGRGNRSLLDETDYEPKIVKKQQIQEMRVHNINGSPTLVQQEGIRVKEIYDYPFTHSNLNKREKELRSQYFKNGYPDGGDSSKKKDSKKKSDDEDFMNKSVSLDASHLEDVSNNTLKSHIAKKTVQEVAFRGKELMSNGDLKTMIGMKSVPESSLLGASAQQGKSDLFKGGSGGLLGSGTTTAASNTSTTATTSGTDSQKKSLFGNEAQDTSTSKSTSGLFANAPKAAATTETKPAEKDARASLFGSETLTPPKTSTTIQTPSLTKTESTVPQAAATDDNKGIPRVPTSTDLASQNPKPASTGMFANLNSNTTATGSSLTTENKEQPKAGGLFSNTEKPATEVKPSSTGLFSSLPGAQSNTPAAPSENKPAAGGLFGNAKPAEPAKEEAKTSLFGGGNASASLFGNTQTTPPATNTVASTENKAATPTPPANTQAAAPTQGSLFGGALSGFGNTNNASGSGSGSGIGSGGLFGGNSNPPETKPAPPQSGGSLFGGLTQNQSPTKPSSGGMFSNLSAVNQGAAPAAGENKTETPSNTGIGSGGLFSNANTSNNTNNAAAPKAGGMFANLNNATANTGSSGELFSGMAGGSGTSMFANKGDATKSLFGNS